MLEHSVTIKAESVEKAIKLALVKLNVDQADVHINVISEGKKGLFGFGKQDAIVEVSLKEKISLNQLTESLDDRKLNTVETNEVFMAEEKQEEVFSGTLDVSEKTEIVEIEDINQVESSLNQTSEINQEVKENTFEASDEAAEEVEGFHLNMESLITVARYLEDVIKAYGANSHIEIETHGKDVTFNIETDKSGLIIGKHGKIIDALQSLAQVMVHRSNPRRTNVLLNVGDYRGRRASVLEQIAERTAKQVIRTKQAVILDPLPAFERKQIHAHLSKIDHISTHSEGKEPNRYLVVEYEN